MANLKQHKGIHGAAEWKAFSHSSEPHEYIPGLTNYFALMWNFKRGMRPIYLFVFSAS